MQVIFEALVEDTGKLSVDIRRSWDASIVTGVIEMPSFPFTKSFPSLLQPSKLPIPEQLNSATPLSDTLTDRGGTVISTERKRLYN